MNKLLGTSRLFEAVIQSGLLLAVTALADAAPADNAAHSPQVVQASPSVVAVPAPSTPSASFVIVQTSYLEQLAATQKSTLEAVAATSQEAIKAARDKEEWLVRLTQTVGIVFAAIAVVFGFFGMTKYAEVHQQLTEINNAAAKAKEASANVDATAAKLSEEFAERISQIEKLFVGLQTQKMIMAELIKSTDKKKDASASVAETMALYALAETYKNARIQSYVAATLTIIFKHLENWEDAARYGKISVDCNPKRWPDRIFNLACIHARKFGHSKEQQDREKVKELLKEYFERDGKSTVSIADIDDALADDDFKANPTILADIEHMKREYSQAIGHGDGNV